MFLQSFKYIYRVVRVKIATARSILVQNMSMEEQKGEDKSFYSIEFLFDSL